MRDERISINVGFAVDMYLLRHSLLGSWILVAFHAIYDYYKQTKRTASQQYMLELKPSIHQYNMFLHTIGKNKFKFSKANASVIYHHGTC